MSSLEKLIKGYEEYREGYFREHCRCLEELGQKGQSPKIAVVACCDSRVDPTVITSSKLVITVGSTRESQQATVITSSKLGDLFVIRNVANLVPPFRKTEYWHGTSAALEFAVRHLNVEHIIVLGHANCGGIRSLFATDQDDAAPDEFIGTWMSIADKARQQVLDDPELKTLDERAKACEQISIQASLANLMTYSWIRERVEDGRLELHGWYYNVVSGELLMMERDKTCLCEAND